MKALCRSLLCLSALSALLFSVQAQIIISEIHYHPVAEPAFDSAGNPRLDLYEDIHEFIELHNPSANAVSLAGWRFSGGIDYRFPTNALLNPGQFLVVAKDPAQLAAVTAYGLTTNQLLGPFDGYLSNSGETVRLKDGAGELIDSVAYSAEFPWAISADALGAGPDFTGINPVLYQYRGRSLERVSFTHNPNDPANWVASPLRGNPSPGKTNAFNRAVPHPVVISIHVYQETDESAVIRNNQPVRIDAAFSATDSLAGVTVEWFLENIESTTETRTTTPMAATSVPGQFTVVLPGQTDRSIVRYRFHANRGGGDEVVSPRADDPFSWHAYFVSPVRTAALPVYDVFVSSESLSRLASNISQNPRRVTAPDPPGYPRESWNATEPALFVHAGVVYEMRMRHHGSRYNRGAGRNSFKFQFPRYKFFNGYQGVFETDKGDAFVVGHGIFDAAGFPTSRVRYTSIYINGNSPLTRLEQEEMDDRLADRWYREQRQLYPDQSLVLPGEFYKSTGTIEAINPNGEGPYGVGDERLLPAIPPYWTPWDRYRWTYGIQSAEWKGASATRSMLEGLWAARGDSHTAPNPNVPALRAWLEENFDMEKMLTYLAIMNWTCPWDDSTQNHFLWQQRNGRWSMLPWDMDGLFNSPGDSVFMGEVGNSANNFRGPNWIKDSVIKAYRNEYKERLFILNNTLLHPDNLRALGFGAIYNFAQQRLASVNQQLGLGAFQRPNPPAHLSPSPGQTALPPQLLRVSAYSHTASPAPSHASTTWIIRRAGSTYRSPVFHVTSRTNLTSIPIPFEKLQFGESYFWLALFTDANGHASLPSAETRFAFGPASSLLTLVSLDPATLWRFNQSGSAPAGWKEPSFDDTPWTAGPALLAVENSALPEPIRTPLTLGRTTYYFRHAFQLPADPQGVTLRLSHVLDDGAVFYLNGQELWRTGMNLGTPSSITLASRTVGDAAYEGPFDVPSTALRSGTNVLAVEVHQVAGNSSDIVFGMKIEATVPSIRGGLLLNEIAAANSGSVTRDGSTPDWIELFNNGSVPIDLSGMSLSDDVQNPVRFTFPANTLIAAQGYLLVWCDDRTNAPGLHTGFALNDAGQTVVLLSTNETGPIIRDVLTFGLQIPDATLARLPNGTGAWSLAQPTPGDANRALAAGNPAGLKINEWMASPASGDDWIELHNPDTLPVNLSGLYFTDDAAVRTNTRLPDLSFISAGGFVKLVADGNPENGANHVAFKLAAGGETILLSATDATTLIDTVTFRSQTADVSQGRLPDGTANIIPFPATPSPAESNHLPLSQIVISEVLSHTDPPLEDAIELFNPTAQSVDLSGWFLSDQHNQLKKHRIPGNTILPPGGFLVLYEVQFNADTNLPASFSLSSATGDDVYLSQADPAGNLTGYRTHVDFGAAENGISFGRHLTSAGVDFAPLSFRSFGADEPNTIEQFRGGGGASNAYPKVGPVVISEIMYHPPDLGTNDNTRDEFVELLNISPSPVPLFDPKHPQNTWRLRDAARLSLPPVTLPPGGTLLLVNFDPATNSVALDEFRRMYALPKSVPVYGPYAGTLSNSRDSVELIRPDEPVNAGPNVGVVPEILVDKVQYRDAAPWPIAADGNGPSLHRLRPTAYGNDPANWKAAAPTPSLSAGTNAAPQVILTRPAPGASFAPGSLLTLAATASDSDGYITAVEFYDGAAFLGADSMPPHEWRAANFPLGTHTLKAVAIDNGGRSTPSMEVTITVTGVDDDQDGLPDDWEAAHGFRSDRAEDAAEDADNDGLTNLQEYLAGTDPRDPGSVLKLAIAPLPSGSIQLRFDAAPNLGYSLQYRSSTAASSWLTLTNIPPRSVLETLSILDPNPPATQRYYRIFKP